MGCQDKAVHSGMEGQTAEQRTSRLSGHLLKHLVELGGRQRQRLVDAAQPAVLDDPIPDQGRFPACPDGGGSAAEHDRLVEQACRLPGPQQDADRHSARGLAHDRHVRRVPAERRDVVPDPAQSSDLIKQAEIRRGWIPIVEQITESPEPIVDRDEDDAVVTGEESVLEARVGAGPAHEGTPMDPHQDRPQPFGLLSRRPDVQVQAVLRARQGALRARWEGLLHGHRPEP